jgi:hypothetical protein
MNCGLPSAPLKRRVEVEAHAQAADVVGEVRRAQEEVARVREIPPHTSTSPARVPGVNAGTLSVSPVAAVSVSRARPRDVLLEYVRDLEAAPHAAA